MNISNQLTTSNQTTNMERVLNQLLRNRDVQDPLIIELNRHQYWTRNILRAGQEVGTTGTVKWKIWKSKWKPLEVHYGTFD